MLPAMHASTSAKFPVTLDLSIDQRKSLIHLDSRKSNPLSGHICSTMSAKISLPSIALATRAGHTENEAEQSQNWDAEYYQSHCSFVSALGSPVLDLLAPVPGERVLDLGCGDGTLAAQMKALGCHVLGVDSSAEMVAEAQAKGVEARVVDGHMLGPSFGSNERFDAVFSNAALHWMKRDPAAVVAGVRSCLKPGGRFVGEMGGFGNVACIVTALLASLRSRGMNMAELRERIPWYFPTTSDYRSILEKEGFTVEYIELIPRPTELPSGIQSWLTAFAGPFFSSLSKDERDDICSDVESLLAPSLRTSSGTWFADYVRLRFKAVLDSHA